MGNATKRIIEAAMELPEDDRLDVASALWASVDHVPSAEWDRAWLEDVERRDREGGEDVPWDTLHLELIGKLAKQ